MSGKKNLVWKTDIGFISLKGSVISSDPPLKMAMLDSQRYPLSSYLFNIVEDIVYFLGL